MTLRWYYAVDAVTVQEWTDRVRLPLDPEGVAIGVGKHAEAGSGWEGDLLVDDPDLSLPRPKGKRRIYAVQDAAPAGAQVVGNWFIEGVKVRRLIPRGRVYVVTMADENSLLSRRKWTGADANRGIETDIARIRWALLETELNTLSPDETYIDTTDPVTLEASDLRDHSPEEMLMTMFQKSKKEHWVKYEETAAVGGAIVSSSVAAASVITTTTAHGLYTGMQVTIAGHAGSTPTINGLRTITVTGATTFTIPVTVTVGGTGGTTSTVGRYVLCYFNPNTSELLPSTISISNDPADTIISGDNPTSLVYPLHDEAELDGAIARLSSGLIVPHLGASKRVYVQDTTVGDAYAYVDNVANPPIPIKTEAEATAYAASELAELAVPDDEVTTTLTIAEARMNLVMAGMIVPVHATHFPNYTEDSVLPGWATQFVSTRVKRRMITQIGPKTFEMPLTLSPMTVPPCDDVTAAGTYPHNGSGVSAGTGNVVYFKPGIPLWAGNGFLPDPGYVGEWNFPDYNVGVPPYDAAGDNALNALVCMVQGDGTIDIYHRHYGGTNLLIAYLQHEDPANPGVAITDQTIGPGIVPGGVITFEVSSHEGTACNHRVWVTDDGGGGGGGSKWGFEKFIWTPA